MSGTGSKLNLATVLSRTEHIRLQLRHGQLRQGSLLSGDAPSPPIRPTLRPRQTRMVGIVSDAIFCQPIVPGLPCLRLPRARVARAPGLGTLPSRHRRPYSALGPESCSVRNLKSIALLSSSLRTNLLA
jgi:hypothetical protein